MRTSRLVLVAVTIGAASCVHSQENAATGGGQGIFKRLFGAGDRGLDTGTIESGLREALKVGIERTVTSVGREDGYFGNADIRIPPPGPVEKSESLLRGLGYGSALDEFELSMNRAAEAAAPLALDIFAESISQMTIADAREILEGSDTAATAYLREHSSDQLKDAFRPIVRDTMAQFDVNQRFDAVTSGFDRLPFVRDRFQGSIEDYTLDMALDGLFFVLAQEETRIRENPAARTTDLLRKVFGRG